MNVHPNASDNPHIHFVIWGQSSLAASIKNAALYVGVVCVNAAPNDNCGVFVCYVIETLNAAFQPTLFLALSKAEIRPSRSSDSITRRCISTTSATARASSGVIFPSAIDAMISAIAATMPGEAFMSGRSMRMGLTFGGGASSATTALQPKAFGRG